MRLFVRLQNTCSFNGKLFVVDINNNDKWIICFHEYVKLKMNYQNLPSLICSKMTSIICYTIYHLCLLSASQLGFVCSDFRNVWVEQPHKAEIPVSCDGMRNATKTVAVRLSVGYINGIWKLLISF